ncbi:MAG: MmgE/PrpD family protein [Okeania sp. SIO2C2]|uniref:MmgE/PrpD family protein n=1 Tax=Okeania sp. SIO2C2 TaxID=2607787 RepID=UPI0013BA4141|nr:MmgE/PrpD family protein [Okeania sp. SIO2C2]NEP86339.1 MmgE/PrpD family protein [Okeania sp. SIO2C2]
MSTTQQLAAFVQQIEYHNLPETVVNQAKNAILDTLGVMLAGATTSVGNILLRYAESLGGTKQSSALGTQLQTSSPLAALVNGTFAHSYDYDDDNWAMMGHPSAPVLSAALAVAEAQGATGKELLTAYILGYEIEAKIGRGMNPAHYRLGWHPTSTLGIIGATVATAKLLGLSSSEIAMALGIAASLASGLRANFGTMTKPLHVGHAAMSGVQAATLAQMGLTAHEAILETSLGFAEKFTQENGFQFEPMTDNLGNPYEILRSGSCIKQYPCCAFTHRAIDAILELVKVHDFSAEEVEEVECFMGPASSGVLKYYRPLTGLEAKFSMEYCLAAAIADKKLGLSQFTDENVHRPDIQRLLARVKRQVNSSIPNDPVQEEQLPVLVKVKLVDGRYLSQEVAIAKGHPQNPLTESELKAKFWDCASLSLSSQQVTQGYTDVLNLEKIDSIKTAIKNLISSELAK